MDLTHPDLLSALFAKPDLSARREILAALVMDLFVETEALREAVMRLESCAFNAALADADFDLGHSGLVLACGKTVYQKAYLATAFETHNNGGPSGGLDKLLARFYPPAADETGRTWRECLLLARLGFSPSEIAEYKRAAEEAEMLT
jgi:hypothetical protein